MIVKALVVMLTNGKHPPAKPFGPPTPRSWGEHDRKRFARGFFGYGSE
jgi:hypothetical protein